MKLSLLQKNGVIMKKPVPNWFALKIRSPSGDIDIILLFTLNEFDGITF